MIWRADLPPSITSCKYRPNTTQFISLSCPGANTCVSSESTLVLTACVELLPLAQTHLVGDHSCKSAFIHTSIISF